MYFSEEKENVNQSVESTPQTTPIPTNTTAPPQTPNNEQQPEVDEDGYCIQPRDPLWNTQWPKKGQFKLMRKNKKLFSIALV